MIVALSSNTWIIMMIMWSWIISICMISNVKIYMFFYWCYLGDHVRLWLCLSTFSLRVNALLFLLQYMNLWWLYRWCYGSVQDNSKIIMIISMCLYNAMLYVLKWNMSCLVLITRVPYLIHAYEICEYEMSWIRMNTLSLVCLNDIRP